jgi:hypothetical protein
MSEPVPCEEVGLWFQFLRIWLVTATAIVASHVAACGVRRRGQAPRTSDAQAGFVMNESFTYAGGGKCRMFR